MFAVEYPAHHQAHGPGDGMAVAQQLSFICNSCGLLILQHAVEQFSGGDHRNIVVLGKVYKGFNFRTCGPAATI